MEGPPKARLRARLGRLRERNSDSLEIVLIHLGAAPPAYMQACISQVEAISGRSPLVVDPATGAAFNSPKLDRFRAAEELSGYGLEGFWRYACERFFVLEEFMAAAGLDRCIHLETDTLLYVSPSRITAWLDDTYGESVAVCPLTDTEDTAAFMYVGSRQALSRLNDALLELVEVGPERLLETYGEGMAHEMKMLHILRTRTGLCEALPTLPGEARATGSSHLFDPGSYGQYVDGTVFEPGVSYAADHHLIGRELRAAQCRLVWDAPREHPLVYADAEFFPLVNLHVHSKRLEEVRSGQNRRQAPPDRRTRLSRRARAVAHRVRARTGRLTKASFKR
ncbi:MAG: hypothetical protein ACJ75Z_03895 [Solirubrobacterales bacterium]